MNEELFRFGTNDGMICYLARNYFPNIVPYAAVKAVVDVGAHIGGFADFIKEVAPQAVVISVEPDRENAEIFTQQFNMAWGVYFYEMRVAYEWKDVVLVKDKDNTGGRSYIPRAQADKNWDDWHRRWPLTREEAPADLQTITLERLLEDQHLLEADVLKIDCEGAEFDILMNAPLTTLAKFKWIVGEAHFGNGDFREAAKRIALMFQLTGWEKKTYTGLFCFRRIV